VPRFSKRFWESSSLSSAAMETARQCRLSIELALLTFSLVFEEKLFAGYLFRFTDC
jgi:hypothetical protein